MKLLTRPVIIILILMLSSCITYKRASTFSKCEFRINRVESAALNGIDVYGKSGISDLSLSDSRFLLESVVSGPLIMDMTILVDIKNPNKSTAAMNRIDWIFYIDGLEIMTGSTIQRIILPPNDAIAVVPLDVSTNLKDIVAGKRPSALLSFALHLAGIGKNTSRITIKAKPYITIGRKDIAYPGYITIRTDFSSD